MPDFTGVPSTVIDLERVDVGSTTRGMDFAVLLVSVAVYDFTSGENPGTSFAPSTLR
jgi:hypothetical protein